MTLQAWHTGIWGIYPILLCRSSQALSGWMGSEAAQLFSGFLQICLIKVQVRAPPGPLKDIQRLVLLHRLGCVLRVVVLLEGEPLPQSEVLSALKQVFIKDPSVHCAIQLYPRSWLVSQSLPLKNIPRAWCSHHHASPDMTLGIQAKESFRCLLANANGAVMCLLRSGFRLATTIMAWLVECWRNGCPSGRFSHLHRGTLELCQWPSGSWGPQCCRMFLVTFPRSVPWHNPVSELYRQFLRPHG